MNFKKIVTSFWENIIAKTLAILFFAIVALFYSILKWEVIRDWLKFEIPVWIVLTISIVAIITFYMISKLNKRPNPVIRKKKLIDKELAKFKEYVHPTNENVKFVFRLYSNSDTLEPFIGRSGYKLWCLLHNQPLLMGPLDNAHPKFYVCSEMNCDNRWDFDAIDKQIIDNLILSLAEEKIVQLR